MSEMQEQTSLMDEILTLNTKISILGQKPTSEELTKIRTACKAFKGYKFDTEADDMSLIKQIAEFGNSYKNFRN